MLILIGLHLHDRLERMRMVQVIKAVFPVSFFGCNPTVYRIIDEYTSYLFDLLIDDNKM